MAESDWTLLANLEQDLHFSLLELLIFSWSRKILSNQLNPTVLQRAQFLSMLCSRKGRSYIQFKAESCSFPRAGVLHWSPSRKPWPQLCLPPPRCSSAALLMLAGGTPNPDTPPLLFGSQRYLGQARREGESLINICTLGVNARLFFHALPVSCQTFQYN